MSGLTLHGYFRSSAAWRVRIALALKGLSWQSVAVNLVAGEQHDPRYRSLNPQSRVPTLVCDGAVLTQSPAILEYLEERFPDPPLLPSDARERARIRAVCAVIGCDIHPLNNLAVLRWLEAECGVDEPGRKRWYAHWIDEGFRAIETMLAPAPFSFADKPCLADCYLAPQIFNARRFAVPLDDFPRIRAVADACAGHPAFASTAPENQPDAA